ncbi:hypothetical protein [Microvirga soli]|uniref:hypothetical protein n=1 Tax=Microvirga soli TaxID=1854496 RepID=UPI00191DA41C|nr:hypothetical protein [Microvirga soli]
MPETAERLNLDAAPTFAAMALVSGVAASGPTDALSGPGSGCPLDAMVVMYLLMCTFHVTPWLKRLGGRRAINDRRVEEESECSQR